jgi:hypothetical protein
MTALFYHRGDELCLSPGDMNAKRRRLCPAAERHSRASDSASEIGFQGRRDAASAWPTFIVACRYLGIGTKDVADAIRCRQQHGQGGVPDAQCSLPGVIRRDTRIRENRHH